MKIIGLVVVWNMGSKGEGDSKRLINDSLKYYRWSTAVVRTKMLTEEKKKNVTIGLRQIEWRGREKERKYLCHDPLHYWPQWSLLEKAKWGDEEGITQRETDNSYGAI